MSKITHHKLITGILSISLIFIFTAANAQENPFNTAGSISSYMLVEHHGGNGHGMKKIDTNGDGEISKEEFMTHKEMKFMKMDKNSDGKLSSDEMKHKKCRHDKKKHHNKDES